jgi:phosphate transport system substrate-binding protein
VKSTSLRRRVLPAAAVLALALSATACGAGNESNGGSGDSGGDAVTLNGGGATSQAKAQGVWRAKYQDDSGNTVNYEEVGSGTGRENFNSGAYSFAGSDSYLNDDEGELSAAKERCNGEDPIEVPAYVSPIAVAFNLPGVDSLNMSPKTIADIFSEKITKWNDPAIAADNDGVDLPDTAITTVHRSDDSGTTQNFTEYLAATSEGAWAAEPDSIWPEDLTGGQGLEGTSGVVGGIQDTEGAIGYADDSAVGDLGVVSIGVGDEFNAPSAEGAAMVLAKSPRAEGRPDVDMAIDIDRTITEKGAYPLLLASYLIACQHYDGSGEADAVKGYLSYVVSTEGQQAAADEVGSAPLDSTLQQEAAGIVDKIAAS